MPPNQQIIDIGIKCAEQAHSVSRSFGAKICCIGLLLHIAACSASPQAGSSSAKTAEYADTNRAVPLARADNASRLRIMSYNVLKYGDGCQGDAAALHGYLRSIIRYVNPDIVGLVKVAAIPVAGESRKNSAPEGFDLSIRDNALNAAFPDRYAVCPFTNKADGNNVNLLFYDKRKMGYAGMQTVLSSGTDFNLFKLYLRSSITGSSKDTAFLYVLLNHTESGDNSKYRDAQMLAVTQTMHKLFPTLPPMIDMGDFNLRNTSEPGYSVLTNGEASHCFVDPPFALDHSVSYPADWENTPEAYSAFLTTSTRKNDGEPNDCGTSGGAKFWFDHILLSPAIAEGKGTFRYVPKSFRVIGNDGGRTGRSINAGKHPNTSVSPQLAEALFQFSNKYPVMLELETAQPK